MDSGIDRLRAAVAKAHRIPDNWAPGLLEGVITGTQDPDGLGRAKVLLDHFRGNDGTGYETDWMFPLEFRLWGVLPRALIGQRVLCHTVNHSYENMRVSLGVKPLVFKAQDDQLPQPVPENLGLVFVRQIAQESYLCTIALRNGQIALEALSPLHHLHNGGDTLTQGNDSGSDFQQPIPMRVGSDNVYITSVTPYLQDSGVLPPATKI
jgi:hypothetical protein